LTTMIYDVLVVSDVGGERRFTTERDAPLSNGDTFEQDSESYRVLAIQAGHGPFRWRHQSRVASKFGTGAPALAGGRAAG
jgi:hypothetical protein